MLRFQLAPPDTSPILVDVPHSGLQIPEGWDVSLPREAWERSADLYVDELLADVWGRGVSMLVAEFPRVYCDVNRAANDFDPQRLAQPDDPRACWFKPSPAALKGMGVCWSTCGPEKFELWSQPPEVDEIEMRVKACWHPYDATLHRMRADLLARHGCLLHLNMHSMPRDPDHRSSTRPLGQPRPDIEIGTLGGISATPATAEAVARAFRDEGLRVEIDQEFRGQDLLRRHADPSIGCNSLQIEINRGLYLEQDRHTRSAGFSALQQSLTSAFRKLERYASTMSRPDTSQMGSQDHRDQSL